MKQNILKIPSFSSEFLIKMVNSHSRKLGVPLMKILEAALYKLFFINLPTTIYIQLIE